MDMQKLLFTLMVLVATCTQPSHSQADSFGSGLNTFDIEFVTIGNPGNADDTTGTPNPAGKVDYAYRIGKYETSEDMIDKANAEAALGITKDTRGPDKPATGVSWFEAAQFVNWLNTSTGSTPAYKFDDDSFELWQSGDAGFNSANPYRNSQATYFLPSMDEWYKAAFYDPSGVYYDYPTGSDSVPDGVDSAADYFDAVFSVGGFEGQPHDITDVGVLSPYGTAGQGGNVFEMEETDFDLVNDSTPQNFGGAPRGLRGGFWLGGSFLFNSSFRDAHDPGSEFVFVGFRVASVIPEPSTLLLAMLGMASTCCYRRRR